MVITVATRAGVTADTVPPEDAVRHGSIYASECGPTSADTVRHSGYDSTIQNTTLSHEMTIVDVRSTPCNTEFGSSRTKINHDRGGSYTGLLQYIVRVSYNFNNHDRERGGYCNH